MYKGVWAGWQWLCLQISLGQPRREGQILELHRLRQAALFAHLLSPPLQSSTGLLIVKGNYATWLRSMHTLA
ncbi:uncharacterized protein CYBJADRAFT_44727 [Cyberlindnera jadinii NRRL Y-1542]|uniref:Uncharacterized protein n=1 Tax=Cyberlindnera jadinii (strain ATCC 18201 / CBS 1600 / BCRC 20928 / JCM 3617 / NBRC 0987 / NRRL Y-1542) TaxID=983966 RepID=A0A1E4S721_CYBJN|nr:hypothetical protein CYBJADRAFT_44727 [Cyberlindnera jadinii NRRL Y-1542]ODV75324.1 hypothetical protein CYBJADRAFT_44727 [Cyberlindnera jadinii NRRL Y-1542]